MRALFIVPLVVSIFIIGLFIFKMSSQKNNTDSIIGKKISYFTLPSILEGESDFSYDDIKGKYVLINIFASWCMTCKIEHEYLMKISEQEHIPIYGVAWNDDRIKLVNWFKDRGNPYQKIGLDNNSFVILDLGATAVPESFLISPDGVILSRYEGVLDYDSYLRNIKPLIK